MAVKLGSKVRDKVTGFTGIATGRIEYLHGCIQFCISPPVDKDGKIVEATWFDEARVEFVDDGVTVASKPTGGASGRGEAPPSR